MDLALFACADVEDCSCFATIHDDRNLRVGALSFALCSPVLPLVEGVWGLGMSLPVRNLGNLKRLLSLLNQWGDPQLNEGLNLCLVTRRIRALCGIELVL